MCHCVIRIKYFTPLLFFKHHFLLSWQPLLSRQTRKKTTDQRYWLHINTENDHTDSVAFDIHDHSEKNHHPQGFAPPLYSAPLLKMIQNNYWQGQRSRQGIGLTVHHCIRQATKGIYHDSKQQVLWQVFLLSH